MDKYGSLGIIQSSQLKSWQAVSRCTPFLLKKPGTACQLLNCDRYTSIFPPQSTRLELMKLLKEFKDFAAQCPHSTADI